MLRAAILALLVLLPTSAWAVFSNFPSNCTLGGACGGSTHPTRSFDQDWVVPEYLSNPVWKGNSAAGLTVSGITKASGIVRLQYGTTEALGTTQTDCYHDRITIGATEDTDGTCNVAQFERVDFVLDALTADTRYYYRLQFSYDGGTNWASRPLADFLTLADDATDIQRFAVMNDEHGPRHKSVSACGTFNAQGNSPAEGQVNRYIKLPLTVQNVVANNATRNYRGYISTGDFAMTHTGGVYLDHPCLNVEGLTSGGCGWDSTCEDGNIASVQTDDEAKIRYIQILKDIQPALRYMPLFWTLGNHDPEFFYGTHHGATVLDARDEHWVTNTSSVNDVSRSGRLATIPNPDFTYAGTEGEGDSTGVWFSFAAGSAEFIVACAECGVGADTDNTSVTLPGSCGVGATVVGDLNCNGTAYDTNDGDQPGSGGQAAVGATYEWDEWFVGQDQCDYLVGGTAGSCDGSAGRIGDTTWNSGANVVTPTFKVEIKHHGFGSTTRQNGPKWYGRHGLSAVERFCSVGGNPCGSTSIDCLGGGDVCPAYTGLEPFNGHEDELQRAREAWITASSGAYLVLQGHDHFSIVGQKYTTGPTATKVYYAIGARPLGDQAGPVWLDNLEVWETLDWGGLDNGGGSKDGINDFCNSDLVEPKDIYDQTRYDGLCDDAGDYDTDGIATVTRGYLDLEINGTTDMSLIHYYTITDEDTANGLTMTNNSAAFTTTLTK